MCLFMIDRDVPDEQLFSDVRGRFTDWNLIQIHARQTINKYLEENWNGDFCDPNALKVKIHNMAFKNGEVRLELISNELLNYEDINEFCRNFRLQCNYVYLKTKYDNSLWLKGRTKLGDGDIIYSFVRADCEVYYLKENLIF